MIVFSLRAFRASEGKYLAVDEQASAKGPIVVGYLCAANGVVKKSRPDAHLSIHFQVTIDDPARLAPTNPESTEWLKAFVERTK
jgi:hypothetical protein